MKMMKRIVLATMTLGLCLAGRGDEEKTSAPTSIPKEWRDYVTDTAQLPIEKSAWGSLQWVCSGKLSPGAAQTVGIAHILPGQHNPVHYHPNCEEVLHVLSGRGLHSFNGRTIELKAGMTIRIPAGTKHNMINTGAEPIVTLVSFSSGDRQAVFLEEKPSK